MFDLLGPRLVEPDLNDAEQLGQPAWSDPLGAGHKLSLDRFGKLISVFKVGLDERRAGQFSRHLPSLERFPNTIAWQSGRRVIC